MQEKVINQERKGKWRVVIITLAVLIIISFFLAGFISLFIDSDYEPLVGNVALIEIKGTILGEDDGNFLFEDVASSTEIIKLIKKAEENPEIKAIIFEINSPGGSAVASDEISQEIKKSTKPTVAWIREIGTSGAYWIASANDVIIANKMSITGSIGVIASYLQFSGFLQDHNISYVRLVSGQYKDIGSPFKEPTQSEKLIFQKSIDKIHDYFVEEVAKNRDLEKAGVESLASGMFYLGSEAKELGLIDILGGKDEAINYIEDNLEISAEIVKYKSERSIFDVLGDVLSKQSFFIGKGISNGIFTRTRTPEKINIIT